MLVERSRIRFALAALTLVALALLAAPAAGSAAGPQPFVVTPSPLVAPKTTVNTSSEFVATLENPGEQALIENLTVEGSSANQFQAVSQTCGKLVEGGTCQITFRFSPTTTGKAEATLRTDWAGRSPETFTISGEAFAANFAFTPSSHDFGALRPRSEDEARFTFTLHNEGEAPAPGGFYMISGEGANQFQTSGNDCNRTVAPGESCSLPITFRPDEAGTFNAQLRSFAGGQEFDASLTGRGANPQVGVTPTPFDFGPVGVGAPAQTRTLTVTNTGLVPTTFFLAVIAGGDGGDFHLGDEHCTMVELRPGDSCQIGVTFSPTVAGARAARLALFGEGEGATMVSLGGEGVAAAATLLPAAADFGAVAIGQRSDPRSFTFRNEGALPLTLGEARISGTDLDQFALAGDTCSGATVAPGDSCTLRVRFAPDRAGPTAASLRLPGNGVAISAALAGNGTEAAASAARRPDFRWRGRAALSGARARLGAIHCATATACRFAIGAKLRLDSGRGKLSFISLRTVHTSLAADATQSLALRLPARARARLDRGHATLVVKVRWSSDGREGTATTRLGLG